METITTAFTAPGAHVVLVDTDTPPATATHPATDAATTTTEASMAAAREAVQALERTVDTRTIDTGTHSGPHSSVASPRPFWADLVTDTANPSAVLAGTASLPPYPGTVDDATVRASERGPRADLVLVSLPAHAGETVPLDRLALLAADQLRHGGILAVYTHSDWMRGRLVDPTGAIVAAAQHADLLYLQHIVALHTPVEKGRLRATPSASVAAEYDRARHRATVRGLPAPHLRAHGDILAFAQPADPGPPPPETGVTAAAAEPAPWAGGGQ